MKLGLMGQVLATAEADLKPERPTKSPQRIRKIHPQLRQEPIDELQMMTAQGFPLAPPVELIATFRLAHFTAALSFFTRSVFSQEKPPSFSGLRPKCP